MPNSLGLHTVGFNFNYDEDFQYANLEHYASLIAILKILKTKPHHSEWLFQYDIHGVVVELEGPPNRGVNRLDKETMKKLYDLEGFRWIEISEDRLVVGLEHAYEVVS